MDFVMPNPVQLGFGLRALKTLALVDGAIDPAEAGVIEAAQRMFGGHDPLEALAPLEPAELAAGIPEPGVRFQVFGALVLMAMADGEVNEAEAALIARFAAALGIEDPAVANLHRLATGHLRRARLDILRRQWAALKLNELAAHDGAGVYWKAAMGMLGLREDRELIARYRGLAERPAGSLGRAYFDYMTANGFAFPGEKGAPPEVMVFHDVTHILSGYHTTPEEEILAAAFTAGYITREVIDMMVFVLSQFQLGLQTAPKVKPERMKLDPLRTIAAFRRGCAVNLNFNEGWDYWPVLDEPVEALRVRYNVLPEADFLPAGAA
jgi:hypothetical protein